MLQSVFTHVVSICANLLGTKESFYKRKEFIYHRIGVERQHTVKFPKKAPPCISPSKYKPPKPVTQKTLR